MFDVLLSIAISFTVTFLAIPVIITVAERKKNSSTFRMNVRSMKRQSLHWAGSGYLQVSSLHV